MATGIGAVKQAFVGALRNISALTAEIGSKGISEGVAQRPTDYPYVIYQVAFAVRDHTFGTEEISRMGFDVTVVSDDQVEAHNLDALIIGGLHDVTLSLSGTGQSSMFCRRTADLSLADLDEASNKVYLVGGTYTVWTSQTM